jgi:hypothetical protein
MNWIVFFKSTKETGYAIVIDNRLSTTNPSKGLLSGIHEHVTQNICRKLFSGKGYTQTGPVSSRWYSFIKQHYHIHHTSCLVSCPNNFCFDPLWKGHRFSHSAGQDHGPVAGYFFAACILYR